MRKTFFAALACAAALIARSPVESVNRASGGLAVKGYDVVAYFEDGRAVKGLPQFTYEWMGGANGSSPRASAATASPQRRTVRPAIRRLLRLGGGSQLHGRYRPGRLAHR